MTESDYIRSCEWCGNTYNATLKLDGSLSKSQPKYCCLRCRRKAVDKDKKDKRTASLAKVNCKACGVEFKQSKKSQTHYCSNACKVWSFKNKEKYQHGPLWSVDYFKVAGPYVCSPCKICDKWVIGHRRNIIPLCDKHQNISYEARLMLARGVNHVSCKWCKVEFCTIYGLGKGRRMGMHCSSECADQSKAVYARVNKAKRRLVTRGQGSDNIDPFKVFERDKWICHLCKRKTLKHKRGSCHQKAPELEHIIAIADGGTHTWGNVACSCRSCNQAKGSSSVGQLGLSIPC